MRMKQHSFHCVSKVFVHIVLVKQPHSCQSSLGSRSVLPRIPTWWRAPWCLWLCPPWPHREWKCIPLVVGRRAAASVQSWTRRRSSSPGRGGRERGPPTRPWWSGTLRRATRRSWSSPSPPRRRHQSSARRKWHGQHFNFAKINPFFHPIKKRQSQSCVYVRCSSRWRHSPQISRQNLQT